MLRFTRYTTRDATQFRHARRVIPEFFYPHPSPRVPRQDTAAPHAHL